VYPWSSAALGVSAPKWRPHPDNPAWAFLSDELEHDLATAVRHGRPVAPVLRAYGITPMSYARWRWVGEARMRSWSDGRPIQPEVRWRYWKFAVALAEARLEHAAATLEQLKAAQPAETRGASRS
jgi:hypothetical protein